MRDALSRCLAKLDAGSPPDHCSASGDHAWRRVDAEQVNRIREPVGK